jgi:hypothetical protein
MILEMNAAGGSVYRNGGIERKLVKRDFFNSHLIRQ